MEADRPNHMRHALSSFGMVMAFVLLVCWSLDICLLSACNIDNCIDSIVLCSTYF